MSKRKFEAIAAEAKKNEETFNNRPFWNAKVTKYWTQTNFNKAIMGKDEKGEPLPNWKAIERKAFLMGKAVYAKKEPKAEWFYMGGFETCDIRLKIEKLNVCVEVKAEKVSRKLYFNGLRPGKVVNFQASKKQVDELRFGQGDKGYTGQKSMLIFGQYFIEPSTNEINCRFYYLDINSIKFGKFKIEPTIKKQRQNVLLYAFKKKA